MSQATSEHNKIGQLVWLNRPQAVHEQCGIAGQLEDAVLWRQRSRSYHAGTGQNEFNAFRSGTPK
jgi:hypothetical protein